MKILQGRPLRIPRLGVRWRDGETVSTKLFNDVYCIYIYIHIWILYIYTTILYTYYIILYETTAPVYKMHDNLFVPAVFCSSCMSCRSCETFEGDPCAVCRTCNRIKWLVTVARLGVHQEAAALQILRDCAGQLHDLVETALITPGRVTAGDERSPRTRERTPEKPKRRRRHRHREEAAAPVEEIKKEAEHKKEKVVKAKKEDKKTESESQEDSLDEEESEEEIEVEEPPKKVKKSKAEETGGEARVAEENHHNPGGASSGARPERLARENEELQDRVDAYATRNPRDFELGTLPSRGGERHHEERGDTRRPNEPSHPPPGVFEEDERSALPRRPVPKPKKNKGPKHRERGRQYRRAHPRR
jgi:hypothetical protein